MPRTSTKPTFEALQAELADSDHKIRKNAITRIARYYRAQAVEPLLGALQDGRGPVRARAVQVLVRLNDPRAYQPIQGLLADKNTKVRVEVIRALGHFGDPTVVPMLIGLLADPKSEFRQAAARSLGQLKDPRGLPPLLAYLAKMEYEEAYHITMALSDFDDVRVIEPLLTLLEHQDLAYLRTMVADALGRMGDQAMTYLLNVLADSAREPGIHACVVEALGKRPRPAFLQPLLAVLHHDNPWIREQAVQALGVLRDPQAIPPLLNVLANQEEDGGVRAKAITALSMLGEASIVEMLIECLSSAHQPLVYAAVKALGELQAVSAIQPLIDVLFREDCVFAYTAIGEALCKLGDPSVVNLLLPRLSTSPSRQRWEIVRVMLHFHDARLSDPLLALLDPLATDTWYDEEVQKVIIDFLGKTGDGRIIKPFLHLLSIAQAHNSRLLYALRRALIALGAGNQVPV